MELRVIYCNIKLWKPFHIFAIYLAIIPEEKVLVLVVDDLDEFVSDPLEPEQGRAVVEVCQLVMQLRDRVISHAQIGADAIRPGK